MKLKFIPLILSFFVLTSCVTPKEYKKPIQVEFKVSPKLIKAGQIAIKKAKKKSHRLCWRYVKKSLLSSGAINSYPKSDYAKNAGEELVKFYEFKRLPIENPWLAPEGSVIVYTSRRAGHVEIKTKDKNGKVLFVSDYISRTPSGRALVGIYAK